jgi:peroxiredoxin
VYTEPHDVGTRKAPRIDRVPFVGTDEGPRNLATIGEVRPMSYADFYADTEQEEPLAAGTEAPDFRLPSGPEQEIQLSDFRGRPVILAFYPADWSPVCSDQMVLYQELMPEFERYDAALLGISVDGVWCHRAFARHRNIRFPLLSDFEPKGDVSRIYRAYREGEGFSERALFVLDPEGVIHWSYVSPPGVNPGADGILRALENMATREVVS